MKGSKILDFRFKDFKGKFIILDFEIITVLLQLIGRDLVLLQV